MAKKKKRFKLAPSQVRPLVEGMGGCIASDRITVDGEPVAYMCREASTRAGDSGWLFTSGTETQEYMDDPANFEVWDVNTIANYDFEIVPFLRAPPGSSYERPGNTGAFVPHGQTTWMPGDRPYGGKWPPPGFPLVEGRYALTKSWLIALSEPYARRIEDGSLVLWRPGVTLWIVAFKNDRGESQAARLAHFTARMSPSAHSVEKSSRDGVTRLAYFLTEEGHDALYAFTFSDAGHLQMTIYFDDAAGEVAAIAIARSTTAL